MNGQLWGSAALVLGFVLVGGLFAGTEIALVSLRESQLAQLERRGKRGERVAAVARDPNRFLAAVQIGVTVAGFFSAAFGASTLAPHLAPSLERLGLEEAAAQNVALVVLTLVIAYVSLVLGELVPKRLALQRAASLALAVGPPLDRFATVMRPVIWFLSASTDAVVRLLGGDPRARTEAMSDGELRELVLAHETLPDEERRILHDVFDAGDRTLEEIMRPRGEVEFLPATTPLAEARAVVAAGPYTRLPVTGDGFDDVLGYLHARDLLDPAREGTVADVLREAPFFPGTAALLTSLATMRREGVHLAIVVDEYGGTDGIVTLEDLVEELVGEIWDEHDVPRAAARLDAAGHVRLAAGLTIEEFGESTGIELPDGAYETVAGYVLARLGRLAAVGDEVPVAGARLVVSAVVGRRVVEVTLVPA
ncbi:MAG: HlyC/CorC family transporter [Actinomycetales bacterium]|nr:HlyC/CorC family transporter [Actinomycetales bacterium]